MDEFYVFPYTTLVDIESCDCINTLYGVCMKDKTLKECVKECENHKDCVYGYYIQTHSENL